MSQTVVCIESESDNDDDVCIVSTTKSSTEIIDLDASQKSVPVTNGSGTEPVPVETIDLEVDPEPGPSTATSSPIKRIKPTMVSTEVTSPAKKKPFGEANERPNKRSAKVPKGDFGSFKRTRIMKLSDNALDLDAESEEEGVQPKPDVPSKRSSSLQSDERLGKEFRRLIQTCKEVDGSVDMEKCIRKKLVGYYREVPQEFVNSKSFKDLVSSVTEEIKKAPHLIYLKLNRIVDELKPRRTSGIVKQEPVEGGGENGASQVSKEELERNAKKAAQIKKLNKALAQIKKRIDELDQEEVDFEEDMNSAHMKVERYKKRACQIYEKLCDISGESKHAQRSIRKPIKFHGTVYPEFNRTLQAFVNKTNIFPDYFDVKKCLEHCNKQYNMQLRPEEVRAIAQDAFVKVGKILQKRRKMDLYEMITYFGGTDNDPADVDPHLQDKLGQNKQHHAKISDLIDKYAEDQRRKGDVDDDSAGDVSNEIKEEDEGDPSLDERAVASDLEQTWDLDNEIGDVKEISIDDNGDGNGQVQEPKEEEIPTAPVSAVEDGDNQKETLPDSVNMDDAIEFMVSNSIDPFAVPETDLLQDFPLITTD